MSYRKLFFLHQRTWYSLLFYIADNLQHCSDSLYDKLDMSLDFSRLSAPHSMDSSIFYICPIISCIGGQVFSTKLLVLFPKDFIHSSIFLNDCRTMKTSLFITQSEKFDITNLVGWIACFFTIDILHSHLRIKPSLQSYKNHFVWNKMERWGTIDVDISYRKLPSEALDVKGTQKAHYCGIIVQRNKTKWRGVRRNKRLGRGVVMRNWI